MLPGISSSAMLATTGSGSLVASISPSPLTKSGSTRGGARSLTTGLATTTVTGASGSVSYAWARISGDATITINSASAASTSFTATVDPDSEKSGVFGCTVADSTGASVTAQVTVTLTLIFVDTTGTL